MVLVLPVNGGSGKSELFGENFVEKKRESFEEEEGIG